MAKWETKLWSNDRFTELADGLIDIHGARIIFTGGAEELEINDPIISDMRGRALNLAGKTTLRQLAALYEKADLVISTDTGPMQLAAAVATPVVALFGPTVVWRTGPSGPGHRVIRTGVGCSPCFKRRCPVHTQECMTVIAVERVMGAVSKAVEFK